ncbi:MAG: hypothetical protein WD024_06050 [Bacillota bacterium]
MRRAGKKGVVPSAYAALRDVLRARGHAVVETSVVLGNIAAWRLYDVLGFKRMQADEWACKWM